MGTGGAGQACCLGSYSAWDSPATNKYAAPEATSPTLRSLM